MKAVVILFSLLAAAMAAPECRWGASYWCQSKATAEQCGQVAYCEKEVWKVEAPDSAIECDVCKFVVGYLDKLLDENKTEAEAEDLVKDLCAHAGSLEKECDALVDAYFPVIWKLLVDNMGADQICAELKLCTSSVKKAPGDLCTYCKFIAGFLGQLLDNNATESEAEEEVEKLCSYLGSFASTCDGFVTSYFPLIWNLLVQEFETDAICTQLKLCTSISVKPIAKTEGALCAVCEMIQGALKVVIKENGTENEVKAALKELCKLLPGNVSSECQDLVNEYFGIIWDIIISEVEQGDLCKALKVCSNTSLSVFTKLPVHLKDSPLCEVCKLVQDYLKPLLTDATEKELEDELESLCQELGSEAGECKTLVESYFPMIWKLLESYVDDPNICSEIGLCTNSTARVRVAKPEGEVSCALCEFALKELENILSDNSTDQEIIDAVEKLCSLLPKTVSTECDTFVKEYGEEIIKLLANGVDPEEVCTMIGLCTSAAQKGHPLRMIINRPFL